MGKYYYICPKVIASVAKIPFNNQAFLTSNIIEVHSKYKLIYDSLILAEKTYLCASSIDALISHFRYLCINPHQVYHLQSYWNGKDICEVYVMPESKYGSKYLSSEELTHMKDFWDLNNIGNTESIFLYLLDNLYENTFYNI